LGPLLEEKKVFGIDLETVPNDDYGLTSKMKDYCHTPIFDPNCH